MLFQSRSQSTKSPVHSVATDKSDQQETGDEIQVDTKESPDNNAEKDSELPSNDTKEHDDAEEK